MLHFGNYSDTCRWLHRTGDTYPVGQATRYSEYGASRHTGIVAPGIHPEWDLSGTKLDRTEAVSLVAKDVGAKAPLRRLWPDL